MSMSFRIKVIIQISRFHFPLLFIRQSPLQLGLSSDVGAEAHCGKSLRVNFFLLCFPERE